MRKSAAGIPIEAIKEGLIQALGPEIAKMISKPVQAIEAEHGLTGNVYIRASAYPRLQHGKWAKQLKKAAKNARYLIAAQGEDCQSCATALGLVVVASPNQIKWSAELERRAQTLAATRVKPKLASNNPRELLRGWYLAASKSPKLHIETTKVRHTMPVDLVTAAEAKKAVAEFTVPHRVVLDMAERHSKKEAENAVKKVGLMVNARLLTKDEARNLLNSKAEPKEILRAAAQIALVVKTAKYSGGEPVHKGNMLSREAAWEGLKKAEAKVLRAEKEVQERVAKADLEQKVRFIKAAVRGGAKGKKLAAIITKTMSKDEAVAAAPMMPWLKGVLNPKAAKVKKYEDATFTRHVASSPDIDVPEKEIRRTARWVRQRMSEGSAGEELDQLIQIRLSPRLSKAASQQIQAARQEHEGLSGHLYVDAAAYAKSGTKGCDEGALKHRANGLKFVKAMHQCGTCVFRNADGACQKYAKTLIDEVPEESREAYRRQTLASHKMTDQEETAAMFAVGVEAAQVATEFGLHNAALDDIDSETPSHETIDGIFFGGFEV